MICITTILFPYVWCDKVFDFMQQANIKRISSILQGTYYSLEILDSFEVFERSKYKDRNKALLKLCIYCVKSILFSLHLLLFGIYACLLCLIICTF